MSPADDLQRRQALCDLMDGAADAAAAARSCTAWRDDARTRADWHVYQLIGDVLRSEDLALSPTRDAALLGAVRRRMDAEPVVLAPAPAIGTAGAARVPRRRAWLAPAAAVAGFMAVAGVIVVTRMEAPPGGSGGQLAALDASTAASPRAALVPVAGQAFVADGSFVRDARLERYLTAHKQYGSSSALAVPGVVLRSATTLQPER